MNVNDSDICRAVLLEAGFIESPNEESADVILTNTCAIRDKAEQKVWQRLRGLKSSRDKAKRNNPHHRMYRSEGAPDNQVVGLLGCMAERLKDQLFEENLVDLVVGPDAYRDLPRLIHQLTDASNQDDMTDPITQAINVQLSLEETYADVIPVREENLSNPHSAFVSIQRGCSNRCSFCIVPFTRGTERSRPYDSIVNEVEQLVERDGIKEVVLLGQNVNSYHDSSESALLFKPPTDTIPLSNSGFRSRIRRPEQRGGYSFIDLVERISDISPELRVRFTSPHPKDYPHELLHLMAERPNICNQLHMPAQSGSTSMLRRMKRGYSREAYLELIDSVHDIIPDVALSSDFIAGFCGETDQEHEDTVTLLQKVQYDQAFLFAYSLREQTHAHRVMEDNVPPEVKQARLQELIDTFRTTVHEKNVRNETGKWRLVLVEGASKRQQTGADEVIMWHGRTDQNKRILFQVDLDDASGEARITDGEWMRKQLLHHGDSLVMPNDYSASSSGVISSRLGISSRGGAHGHSFAPIQSSLRQGDYAVVQVNEAKGHTLRGKLVCKTTLADFATWKYDQWTPEELECIVSSLNIGQSPDITQSAA